MDIKDLLLSGAATPEDLTADFNEQLAKAVQEVTKIKAAEKAEQEKKEAAESAKVDNAREAMLLALVKYLTALGLIDDFSKEDFEELKKYFISIEQEAIAYVKKLEELKKMLDIKPQKKSEKTNAKQEGKDCQSVKSKTYTMSDEQTLANFLNTIL